VKLVSRDIGLMMRSATKVPAPCRWVSRPSSTRPAMALRTVTRDSASARARSRSLGSAWPGSMSRCSITLRIARRNRR
jgi:hypothetical protein